MAKTFHYSENDHAVDGYVMFNFFSFCDGELKIGQSQHVKLEDLLATRKVLKQTGWTPASWKYENDRPVLIIVMTEKMAKLLASKDRDWSADCRKGKWMVWSAAADHEVEFSPEMLVAAQKSF